jgi:protocatechuate 4,5-dioxygenase beta chain
MFAKPEDWPRLHATLTGSVPQPPQIQDETPEVIDEYVKRIQKNFRTLREQVEAYQPDALIVVGDDQNEVFSRACIPALAIYLGAEVSGSTSLGLLGEPYDQNWLTLKGHPELARYLLDGLMTRGFDLAYIEELVALARPAAGLGHAFTRLPQVLGVAERGIPTIMLWVNAYFPPCPSAERCYALGSALREVLADRPERVAILGSGGLSHDPRGPRAGWVDEPLDRWVLDALRQGQGERLRDMFTFDSDTLRSGTGEIRSWIAVAGAFPGVGATVVDYIPARHAVTGLGFAYWRSE